MTLRTLLADFTDAVTSVFHRREVAFNPTPDESKALKAFDNLVKCTRARGVCVIGDGGNPDNIAVFQLHDISISSHTANRAEAARINRASPMALGNAVSILNAPGLTVYGVEGRSASAGAAYLRFDRGTPDKLLALHDRHDIAALAAAPAAPARKLPVLAK